MHAPRKMLLWKPPNKWPTVGIYRTTSKNLLRPPLPTFIWFSACVALTIKGLRKNWSGTVSTSGVNPIQARGPLCPVTKIREYFQNGFEFGFSASWPFFLVNFHSKICNSTHLPSCMLPWQPCNFPT